MPIVGLRAARLLSHIFYAVLCACIYPALDKPVQRRIMQHWSQGLLNILNVRWHMDAHHALAAGQGQLFVANHVSWLDVFAMNAAFPANFIAKSEVGNWPLVGWLSRRTGALFIRRDMLRDTARVNRLIIRNAATGRVHCAVPGGYFHRRLAAREFQSCPAAGNSMPAPPSFRWLSSTMTATDGAWTMRHSSVT